MAARKATLGVIAFLLMVTFGQPLWSRSAGSSGFSSGSGSRQSIAGRPSQRMRIARPAATPGRPDFERMKNMSPEERMKYLQEFAKEQREAMEAQEALAMQQALGVDEREWKAIEPKLKKVKHYREQAFIGTRPPFQSSFSSFNTGPGGAPGAGGFAGGGGSFQFQAGGSFSGMGPGAFGPVEDPDRPLTDGERIIEELQWLLRDAEPDQSEVRQKLDDLRKAREKAAQQWVRAQEDLRKVINLRQEATLMMMGLLN